MDRSPKVVFGSFEVIITGGVNGAPGCRPLVRGTRLLQMCPSKEVLDPKPDCGLLVLR